jgi:hypothetical protein
MLTPLSRLPGDRTRSTITTAQHAFAAKMQGDIRPGCFSQCQVVTKTHIYLVTRTGIVRFSSKRAGR